MRRVDVHNLLTLPELYGHLAATGLVRRVLELARDEDLGVQWREEGPSARLPAHAGGDITSDCCIGPDRVGAGTVVFRSGGVVSGLAALPLLIELFAPGCRAETDAADGQRLPAGASAAVIRGPVDEMLGLERTLLNLLGRLSGVATRTAAFASAIPAGSRAKLYDTRKTTPGLRVLEKYAVRCGGGWCHRMGLYDAVLIKDNHLAGVGVAELAGHVRAAAGRARSLGEPSFIEVEVDTLEQFAALLTLPRGTIDIILLDNMSIAQMTRAAGERDAVAPWLELEASGGVTLETFPAIAATGVDRISVGGLTHSAVSLDVALDVEG